MADFLSENLPNQILHATVKENSNLPDEDILNAFNQAYAFCLEVLDAPDLHTARSESYDTMTDGISRPTLLYLAFAYFLLSFHQEATNLRRFLGNLKKLLETRLPEVFHPIYIAATSMSSLIPGSCSFGYPVSHTFAPLIYEPCQFVSIQHVMRKAEEMLSKEDTLMVLQVLKETVIEASGDWASIIDYEMKRVAEMPDPSVPHSDYRIREKCITAFVVVMRVCAELKVFEDLNGYVIPNKEKFIISFGEFFNTKIKNPSKLYSGAKETDKFLWFFDKMKETAEKLGGDKLDNKKKRSSRKQSKEVQSELF